jgi:hypothetical protein
MYEIKDVTMVSIEEIERLEGQLGHLVTEFNIMEEEEF